MAEAPEPTVFPPGTTALFSATPPDLLAMTGQVFAALVLRPAMTIARSATIIVRQEMMGARNAMLASRHEMTSRQLAATIARREMTSYKPAPIVARHEMTIGHCGMTVRRSAIQDAVSTAGNAAFRLQNLGMERRAREGRGVPTVSAP